MISSKPSALLLNYAIPLYPWLALITALLLLLFLCNMHLWIHSSTVSARTSSVVSLGGKCRHCPSVHSTEVIRMGVKCRVGSSESIFGSTSKLQMSLPLVLTVVTVEYILNSPQKGAAAIPYELESFVLFSLCVTFSFSLMCVQIIFPYFCHLV